MANLQALGTDGVTIIYLWGEGTGTNIDPFKSNFYAYQGGNWAVSVSNFPATQPVSIESLPALPSGTNVIGGITNTGFNINNFPSSFNIGNFPVTQDISGSVSVDNFPLTLAVTGSFYPETQPVSIASLPSLPSGTNAIGSITNASFGISGTLPAFTSTPTFNIGTIGTIATESTMSGINGKLFLPSSLGVKTKDLSFPVTLSTDGVASGIANQIGEVQSSPTTNTILDRLKTINTTLGNLSITGGGAGTAYVSDNIVITRTANSGAYIAGDVYGTLFEITNFAEASKGFYLLNVNIISSLATLPSGMGSFKLYLFTSQPSTIADNAAFTLASSSLTPQGVWLNTLSVITNATAATSETNEINLMRMRGAGNPWGYIVTQSAFTPAASTADSFTITFGGVSI
jgi:hypothetical protein